MKRAVGILSGFLAFLAIVFGVSLLLTAIGWPVSPERFGILVAKARQMPTVLFLILASAVFVAIGIIVLYGMLFKHFGRRASVLLEKNALGETAVSFTALSQITERILKNRNDVRNAKTKVYAIGSSVRIEVRAVASPEVSLLEMTHSLQDEINTAIIAYCGTSVGSIDVTIDQAELPPKRT